MKLSKTSWHYRLHAWLGEEKDIPTNLCPYFWRLFFVLLIMAAGAFITIGAMYKLSAVAWAKKGSEAYVDSINVWIILGVCTGVVLLIILLATDNLLSKFLKAKIGKYCPKITWEDEK